MAPKQRLTHNRTLPKYWRVTEKKGNRYYFYRVPPHLRHKHGGKTEVALGKTLFDAYQTFASFHDKDGTIVTLHDMLDRYLMEVVPTYDSPNTRDSKLRSIQRLRASLGNNELDLVDAQVIKQYQKHIADTRSPTQANRDTECLSHVFTTALDWGLIKHHPMLNKQVRKYSLKARDRYVEDWELAAWASVANPFLLVYAQLKGATGLRQQDLLTIERKNISDTEMRVWSLKSKKWLRFPLLDAAGELNTVGRALVAVDQYYATLKGPVQEWLFYSRNGTCYYNHEAGKASGFRAIWQRSMKKALTKTALEQSFTEHDLRAKVGSDSESDISAQIQLAHSDSKVTRKHYRRRGSVVQPAAGFFQDDFFEKPDS